MKKQNAKNYFQSKFPFWPSNSSRKYVEAISRRHGADVKFVITYNNNNKSDKHVLRDGPGSVIIESTVFIFPDGESDQARQRKLSTLFADLRESGLADENGLLPGAYLTARVRFTGVSRAVFRHYVLNRNIRNLALVHSQETDKLELAYKGRGRCSYPITIDFHKDGSAVAECFGDNRNELRLISSYIYGVLIEQFWQQVDTIEIELEEVELHVE